ncbi:hypothetical protein SCOR_26230 [Sulfidibacter corallicola]
MTSARTFSASRGVPIPTLRYVGVGIIAVNRMFDGSPFVPNPPGWAANGDILNGFGWTFADQTNSEGHHRFGASKPSNSTVVAAMLAIPNDGSSFSPPFTCPWGS